MGDLQLLLSNLKTKLTIIVDDDMNIDGDNHSIVYNIMMSNPTQQQILFQAGFIKNPTNFESLQSSLSVLQEAEQKFYLLSLKTKNMSKLQDYPIYNDILLKTDAFIEDIKHIDPIVLQRLGFSMQPKDDAYQHLQKAFGDISLCLHYYEVPTDKHTSIRDEILYYQQLSESQFVVFLVDKTLKESSIQGKDFIDTYLLRWKENDNLNFISFIITSDPKPNPFEHSNDYFKNEIGKNPALCIEEAYKSLVMSAYAHMFLGFSQLHSNALNATTFESLRHYNNLKNVIEHAHYEGIAPYEAIYEWFHTLNAYFLSKEITRKYSELFGLAHFFDQPNLFQVLESEINTTLPQEVKTFEIYDYEINKRLLPLSPGDVFYKDGKFYILMGQACDLSVRQTKACRNSKIAELLEANFLVSQVIDNKLEEDFSDNRLFINLQNFCNDTNVGTLKIDITQLFSCDFDLLDTALFNREGNCRIDLENALEQDIIQLLPPGLSVQYSSFQEKFKNLLAIKNALDPDMQESFEQYVGHHLDFSSFIFSHDTKTNSIDFGAKRICRIRRPFFNVIYKKYTEYRARVDLNLIHPFQEKQQTLQAYVDFENTGIKSLLGTMIVEFINHKTPLINIEEIKTLLSSCTCTIPDIELTGKIPYSAEIKDKSGIKIKYENGSILIKTTFKLPNGSDHKRPDIRLNQLFTQEVLGEIDVNGTVQQIAYTDNIKIESLKLTPILIPHTDEKIHFDGFKIFID